MFATFDRYRTPAGTYDEMFDGEAVRGPYARIHNRVTALSPEELRARAEFLSRSYVDQGVTFDIGGEEQPFPLDLLPRVIDAPSWRNIEQGVAQRVRALEAFLDDVYGELRIVRDGIIPESVVRNCPGFLPDAADLAFIPAEVRLAITIKSMMMDTIIRISWTEQHLILRMSFASIEFFFRIV